MELLSRLARQFDSLLCLMHPKNHPDKYLPSHTSLANHDLEAILDYMALSFCLGVKENISKIIANI